MQGYILMIEHACIRIHKHAILTKVMAWTIILNIPEVITDQVKKIEMGFNSVLVLERAVCPPILYTLALL